MCWDKFGRWKLFTLTLRWQYLIDLIINNIFLYFTESEICWINFPVIISIFLFTSIEISMRSQVQFSDIFRLKHIDSWINSLLGSINIFLSLKSIFELLSLCFLRKIIVSINCLTQWLSTLKKYVLFKWLIFRLV